MPGGKPSNVGRGNQGRFNNDDAAGVNNQAQFGVAPVPYHIHSGVDSPILCYLYNTQQNNSASSSNETVLMIGGFKLFAVSGIEFTQPGTFSGTGTTRILPNTAGIGIVRTNASAPGTNTTIGASNSLTLIPIGTPTFLNNIDLFGSNFGFKITTAGQYIVMGVAYFANAGAVQVKTVITVNSQQAFSVYDYPGASYDVSNKPVMGLLNLKVGDNVQLWGETSSGSTTTVTGANSYLSLAMV